jgi:hypothetical protein
VDDDHLDRPGRRWALRGFWLAWYWCSWLICLLLLVSGLGVSALAWRVIGVALVPPGLVLLGVTGVIGWQLATTALVLTLDEHGTLTVKLLLRTQRSHASEVRSVRRSALRSGRYTPIVLKTASGTVRLIPTRADVHELLAELRRHNPAITVDT